MSGELMGAELEDGGAVRPVVDLHVDTLLRLVEAPAARCASHAMEWPELHVDAARGHAGGVTLLLTACFTSDDELEPAAKVDLMLDAADRVSSDPSSGFRRVLGPSSFAQRLAGEIGLLATIENARSLEGDLARIGHWRDRGVRIVGVTWNGRNALAAGVLAEPTGGFTAFGREFLAEVRRLELAIDVSHLAPRGVDEVLAASPHAVLATHSNAARVCEHPRNLTDAQLREIAAAGGLVGINFYPPFLRRGGADATLEDVARHALHLAEVVGVEHVALGTDLDGIDVLPSDFAGHQDMPRLAEVLAGAGFGGAEIDGIFAGNFMAWWRRWSNE
ncbi:MAG: dipeptidase [Planctomycetota bacterium]